MKLSTGTVTLLFAEVDCGSAPVHNVPDAHLLVAALRQAVLYTLHAHNGVLLSMHDESLLATFSTPDDALNVAVAIQEIFHPEREEIPVEARSAVRRFRVALHTDHVLIEKEQYVGAAVEHTTHLLGGGHSGQILVSAECAHALQNRWPTGVRLLDLGKFQVSEQGESETVFQVLHDDLPIEFPPLRLAGACTTNLPHPWTSFVGRTAELVELKHALNGTRLLTLIGSQGIGKSRLAMRLASDVRNAFPDGVWIVELPSIPGADLVASTAAWALGAQGDTDTSLTAALIAHLRDRKALLVLDSGDLNLGGCARLVTSLLAPCPVVKFVVCARKGLGLREEAIYCVAPLTLSDSEGDADAERLCRDRAAQFPLPFHLNGPMLTELCALLDGIPLALELAVGGLASEPEISFVSLTRSLRDLDQGVQRSWDQTLQHVLDWACRQLSDTERILLERLSVFHSGWSLEAATAVCCDEFLPCDLLPALLESLRARAFIVAEQRAGFTRERLVDAVRNDAAARLTRRGEAPELRRRCMEYFLLLAEQGALGLTGPDHEGWKAYLEREYVNFRAALLYARQAAEGKAAELRLATALLPILAGNGRPAEGRSLLARATEAQREPAAHSDDYPTARSRYFAAIDHCHTSGDRASEVRYLNTLARFALSQGDFATAMRCYEQAAEVFREMGDHAQETRALHCLGSAARDGGEYAIARDWYERALELNRSLGHRKDEAHDLNALARLAQMQGNAAEAEGRFQESLVLFRALGERGWEAHNMGQILRLSLSAEPLWERSPIRSGAEH